MALSFSFNAISGNFDLISTVTIGTANGLSITDEQVLSLALSSTLTTGALSSTNWNTFNNKFDLPALTSGSVLFSNGTTIAQDNTYLYYDSVTHTLRVGNTDTEGSGIDVNGTTYESTFKVSDIDGTNFAQTILHRHSTTLEPLIVGARSNSNTSAHTAVANNMNLFSIYGVGITGTNYKLFGSMSIASSSSGTISGTSAPGKFTFSTTPNGSLIPATVLTLDQDRSATFTGNVGITSMTAGSVLFSGASGVVSQDNSNLFFDNTNNRLGIGTATPRGLLDVVASSTSGDIHIEAQRGSGVDPKNIFLRPGYDTSLQSNGAVYIGQGPFTGSEAQGAQFCLEENTDLVQARFSNLKDTGFVYNIYSNDLSQYGAIGVAGSAIPDPGYGSRIFIENSTLGGIGLIMNGGDIGFFDQGANPAVVSINSAGETSIGAASANVSAMLDVTSTTKGFLKPRMTTTQRNAIASTATGLEVFDTTLGRSYYYDGSAWRQVMPNPMTTGGDLVYGGTSGIATRLANGTAGQYLKSNGGTAAPSWVTGTAPQAPTKQVFLSGSGTYTTPAGVQYLRVRMIGGGAGGAGTDSGSPVAGSTGGNTTFGTSLLTANGGVGGGYTPGAGGTASVITSATVLQILATAGAKGNGCPYGANASVYIAGGAGASTCFGGGGPGLYGGGGQAAVANTGAGGGAAGTAATTLNAGSGGSAGGFVEAILVTPNATYAYAVGTGGAGGTGSAFSGGNGGSGIIIVEEYYS